MELDHFAKRNQSAAAARQDLALRLAVIPSPRGFCHPANEDVEQHFQSDSLYATSGNRVRPISREWQKSCVTLRWDLSSFCASCYRRNLGRKRMIYSLGRSACCQTHGSRLAEKGRSGWGYACQQWQLCPSSPLLRPPPPSGCHSLPACTCAHTRAT